MTTLPTPRTFLNSLLSSLPKPPDDPHLSTSDPLPSLPPTARPLLTTLHVLFPTETLPALDLLDRRLITRFMAPSPTGPPSPKSHTSPTSSSFDTATALREDDSDTGHVYHVRSAQQQSRYRDSLASSTHYEVRTRSWSCSCPAFAFAAFPPRAFGGVSSAGRGAIGIGEGGGGMGQCDGRGAGDDGDADGGVEVGVGGLTLGDGVPLCKHLLACTLAERAELFAGFVKVEEVSVEEMVGWAAGWGG